MPVCQFAPYITVDYPIGNEVRSTSAISDCQGYPDGLQIAQPWSLAQRRARSGPAFPADIIPGTPRPPGAPLLRGGLSNRKAYGLGTHPFCPPRDNRLSCAAPCSPV